MANIIHRLNPRSQIIPSDKDYTTSTCKAQTFFFIIYWYFWIVPSLTYPVPLFVPIFAYRLRFKFKLDIGEKAARSIR